LEFGKRKAADIMTPIEAVYMVEIDQVIDRNLLKTIYAEKYSRIPVYERDR
jgi:CBS domain containing-hemolysin-like protein